MKAIKLLIPLLPLFIFSCSQKENSKQELLKNPGWAEQWRIMKQNENGEIPRGLVSEWRKADMANTYKRKVKTGLVNFKELGPSNIGGRTHDILIDRADDLKVFAASSSGGLWYTNNGGKKWFPHDDWASNLTITCLAQNPFNYKEIYYGTGVASGGVGLPGEGLFKSEDGGETFSQIDTTANFGEIWDIEHSISDSGYLYLGTKSRGLYRTTNGGKSWERVINSGAVTDIEVFPNGAVLICITGSGIYYSDDGSAQSFSKVSKGLPTGGYNRIEIAKCDSFPEVVFANFTQNGDGYNGSNLGIWKSSNGGKKWTQVRGPINSPSDFFAQPWFTLALGVDPLDSQKVLTGCRDFAYSLDGGVTWSPAKNGHADHMVYTFRRDRPGYFFNGNDGGIYGHNWETIDRIVVNRNNNYNVTQYYAGSFNPDSTGNIAGAQDNGTNYSVEGGDEYYENALGGDGAFCHIHQQAPKTAYMSSQNGNLQKTGDITLKPPFSTRVTSSLDANGDGTIDDGAWFINPFEMNYLNGDMLFFPTRRRLWFSFDGAGSWYALTNYKINLYSVGIPNNAQPKRVYVGGDNLTLWRIDDLYSAEIGGEVNLRVNLPNGLSGGFISNIVVHPRHDNIIYLSLSNYSNQPRVWRIENADTDNPKWINISGDLPNQLPVNWMVVDPYRPDSFFIAGTDFGLYTTADAGKTWVKEDRLPNVMVQNLRLRYSDRKLFIFTYGRGVFTADLERMEDPFLSINEPSTKELSVYPNPAADQLNIEIEGEFEYQVFDLNGKLVLQGKNQKQIDVSELNTGTYLIEVKLMDKTLKSKFLVN
jgi:photosystem II stability/assembly factor-like uncharacterized protein